MPKVLCFSAYCALELLYAAYHDGSLVVWNIARADPSAKSAQCPKPQRVHSAVSQSAPPVSRQLYSRPWPEQTRSSHERR